MKIIDLTVVLNEQTPVYPGDPATKIEAAGVFEKDGFNDHYVSVGTHVGTHIDAPLHMLADGQRLDAVPIDQFVGRGVYVKVENRQFDLEKLRTAGAREGDIVLFHTGLSESYDDPAYFTDYPEVPAEVAEYLVSQRVKMVGFDSCGPDHPPYAVHKTLLGAGVLIIENLTNLAELAGKEFTVYALPIKLSLDGAPARVIAQLE
ncbi:MAG TPA: cyclase family protein [Candidatus Saccharimonadales bacterium]